MDTAMKYFIYISDTKIDMLYAQVPRRLLEKIAIELNIDLKLMGTGVATTIKSNQPEETRYSKLRLVTEYVEKHLPLGWIDAPDSYFKGSLPMRWGVYPERDTSPFVLYFGGSTDHTILGLTGSPQHILGNRNNSSTTVMEHVSPSVWAFPSLIFILQGEKNIADPIPPPSTGIPPARLVEHATTRMTGPTQDLEFLAKTLWRGPRQMDAHQEGNQLAVLLGSPIYVALI
jgi:hypothetical protein